MFLKHHRIRLTEIYLTAEHFSQEINPSYMIYMTMRKNNPPDIRRIKAKRPDRMNQHGRCLCISGIDEQKTISRIDHMNTNPGIACIIDISENPKRLYISFFLIQHSKLNQLFFHNFFLLCYKAVVIVFYRHGNFLLYSDFGGQTEVSI